MQDKIRLPYLAGGIKFNLMENAMSIQQLESKYKEEYQELKRSIKKPNILLLGGTGVGKSSLINTCFGEDLAEVGIGKPVTKYIESFSCDSKPIVLFDTKGYEIGSDKEKKFLNDVVKYATTPKEDSSAIHIAWYCIQANGTRIVDFDISIIKKIYQAGLPIAIVLTKADLLSVDDAQKFKAVIKSAIPEIDIFETTIKDELNNLQLSELCKWSINKLPEGLKLSFASAQQKNIEIKRIEANKIITQHVTGAGVVGFSPIPFSDAPILLLNQTGMLVRILFIYDLEAFSAQLKGLLAGSVISSLISESGIWLVAQIIKMIPTIGTAVGGMISGAVAAAITYAIGMSVSELCATMLQKISGGNVDELNKFMDEIDSLFVNSVISKYKQRMENSK